jgi:putative hydrolase of the HAD superfamily
MRSAELRELDAVTIDGFGTLVELVDPIGVLQQALTERGVERDAAAVAAAFKAEARHYRPRALQGRDAASLAELRRECTSVFLRELDVELDDFSEAFVDCLQFRPVEGAVETVRALRARGLALAVVANWDVALHDHLAKLGLVGLVDTIVTSADAGAAKPDPAIFHVALDRLGVRPERALHVGDEPLDEEGARAAGIRFAPAPLRSLL